MQRVGAVVRGQLKPLAVQFECAVGDPVRVTPDGGAEKAPNREIAFKVVAAEHHIGKAPGTIRQRRWTGSPRRR